MSAGTGSRGSPRRSGRAGRRARGARRRAPAYATRSRRVRASTARSASRGSGPRRAARCEGRRSRRRCSRRWRRASAATSAERFVRPSYIVSTTPLMRKAGIQVISNEIERAEQLGQSFQGVVLTLERDQDGVGGGERVDRQQPEGGWAIDQDVVVPGGDRREQPRQSAFSSFDGREFEVRPGERDGRRHEIETRERARQGSGRRSGFRPRPRHRPIGRSSHGRNRGRSSRSPGGPGR